MTKNQIEYQKLLETRRSNKANEQQKARELAETGRHNVVYENETQRHNIATETISLKELGIKDRQADASMMQAEASAKNAETNRRNQAEIARSNRVYESIGMKNAAAAAQQAVNSQMSAQAQLKQASVAEQNAYAQRDLVDSQVQVNATQSDRNVAETHLTERKTESTAQDTHYRGQENVRGWIDTASRFISSVTKGHDGGLVSKVVDLFS